jgi:GNAT superfamily N-acetyltransferase
VQIERFEPRTDEKRLRTCHELTLAGHQADDPNVPPMTFEMFRGWWAYGFTDDPIEAWLALDDSGGPVGAYRLELPARENLTSAFGDVVVPPARRRRGIGTALLTHMAGQSAQAGRSLLVVFARQGSAGHAFAAATGGSPAMRDIRRRLVVDPALHARLAGLRSAAEPHAAGYTLRCWQGRTPSELVEGLCATYTALGDAPHPDSFEPARWDAARLHAAEERVAQQGTRWYSVAAIARDSGEVAAITQVNVEPARPDWGWQEVTAVTRPHRGHRLGLLVKVAMLELLAEREPDLRYIVTFNAEPNAHMIAVNDQLGYEVTDHFQAWDYDVATAAKLAR